VNRRSKPGTLSQRLLLTALLLTLVVLFGYQFIPLRTYTLLPDAAASRFLYGDAESQNGTSAQWLDYDATRFRCTRVADKESHYCGFNLALSDDFTQGIDLSKFDRLRIVMAVKSSKQRLALFMRNYNPAYSFPDQGDSAQYIVFNVRTEDIYPELIIGLDEFRVADWWLESHDIPRQFIKPEFTNITVIGADFGSNLPVGDHELEIKKLQLQGPWVSAELLYLIVIAVWLAGGFGFFIVQTFHYAKLAKGNEKRYRHLESRHQQLRHQAEDLRHIAQKDKLTGLLNRHGLDQALAKLKPTNDAPMALLILDIDHFKKINDSRGHEQGDQVLAKVAAILTDNTRAGDLVARWGGEEFVIVAHSIQTSEIDRLGEKIRQRIYAEEHFSDAQPLTVSVSIGAVQWRLDETFAQNLQRADQLLYRAKTLGRNCTVTEQHRNAN